jgi:hypothetical protein
MKKAPKPPPKQDDPEHSKRFLEAAKEAGADETAKARSAPSGRGEAAKA